MRPENLSEMQMDAMRELGSVGAAHAATALSQLVGRAIEIEVPEISLLRVTEVPGILGGPEQVVAAAYSRFLGDIGGSILFVVPEQAALALVDHLHGRSPGMTECFGPEAQALFVHVAFVQASAYLAAIARMTDINVLPSPPQFAHDMAGAILQVGVARLGMRADSALLVRTAFIGDGFTLDATLLFLPDPEGLDIVLNRLGLA